MNAISTQQRALPDLYEGQRWFLASNHRKPARTIVEISEATGYIDYADVRGERRLCSATSFQGWARTYRAYVR